MKCPRCRGKMFAEKFYDFVRSFEAWKCTCCGEVVDPTILANRARSRGRYDPEKDKTAYEREYEIKMRGEIPVQVLRRKVTVTRPKPTDDQKRAIGFILGVKSRV